jgi:hypothetical protein
MFQKRNVPFPLDLTAILDIPPSASQNSSQAQLLNNDDDGNDEMFSLDNDNNDSTDTRSDVSLEYEYTRPAPLPTATSPQQQLNALESAEDVENRRDLYHELYVLVLRKRHQKQLTSKNYETYEWPALIKQIIRCRFPSDIKNYVCYKQPDVVFSIETFIDLFAQ